MAQTTDHDGYRITINGSNGSASCEFSTAQDGMTEAVALRVAAALTAAALPAPMSWEIDKTEGSVTVSVYTPTNPPTWT